ncbi:MAG: tRNA (adenosine(37)-N6)-threonylcarbamoyltransferase complex transferase subunit TsaD [Candidatus Pacebacteria bacterium]|nr:tRNA (adenosine(37)-N6)-threonylcarbamoyltransferase complex transferase subunit TsaD [Candidatus Paceibacterota bacterium]MDD5357455.1 tRNA (adenosine(37)-N6)-threonylcarbamoyltransferase complex transferase subunit TsaD [Candidatus Paceibacterota bacterium]
MIILGIETSCDETALSLVEATGTLENPQFRLLSATLFSQTKLHEEHGGVVPMLAKREHQKNLIPLLKKLLEESGFSKSKQEKIDEKGIEKILEREQELAPLFLEYIPTIEKPKIDAIAVTYGPGLEPALWVGVSFAKALSYIWNIPIIPVNHMEGHIVSPLLTENTKIEFPALALLISGGHTELVLTEKWGEYKVIGKTRDDAVGEAFDKVARLLGLPYPGGPEISKLAEKQRQSGASSTLALPRPMLKSDDYDSSFSGLKTSVLYKLKEIGEPTAEIKAEIAKEFEDSVTEVLVSKTRKAIEEFGPQTLIIAGGVSANSHIRKSFEKLAEDFPQTKLLIPSKELSTDNAIMIAGAGYINFLLKEKTAGVNQPLEARGNLSL